MARAGQPDPGALVLVGGHESAGGAAIPPLREAAGASVRVAAPGRMLERALVDAVDHAPSDRPVVVVPMTLGRDPRTIADAGRSVRWAARGGAAGRVALAPPLGTVDHLVGWLRAACRRLPAGDDDAVLIAATAVDPFDDAELYRVAALVRANGPHRLVEVGLRRPHGDLEHARERCRLLGARRVAVVWAELGTPLDADVPLLSRAAIRAILAARVATACHRLAAHRDDGVAAAHAAEHEHGFAHSHDHDHAHIHGHDHDHASVG